MLHVLAENSKKYQIYAREGMKLRARGASWPHGERDGEGSACSGARSGARGGGGGEEGTLRVHIEGWRGVPHSYALTAEAIVRQLATHPAVQLSWSDRSLPSSWATLRAAATGGSSLPPVVEIRGDGSVPAGAVVLRVVWPPDLTPARGARRTLVFITAEHLACPDAGLRKQARAQYQALHCLRRAN